MFFYEIEFLFRNNAVFKGHSDGIVEIADILIGHFFADITGEQAGGQFRLLGLFADQKRRGLNAELIQFLGGGTVVETANHLGGDAHGVDFF